MKIRKIFAAIAAAAMAVSATACASSTNSSSTADSSAADSSAADSSTPAATADAASTADASSAGDDSSAAEIPADKVYNIGICQLVQHEALDAATQGFKDAITEELGDKVTFDEQNAQGDSNTCSTIITDFVSKNVDLILANATPALQAASAGTSDIPILGTAVTEYGVALDLDDFDGTVGGNISGTSDLAPLEDQAAMLNELFPDAKNVGLVYCSAEANSQYQVDTVKAALEELGYSCEYYAFSDSNDLASVCQKAADDQEKIMAKMDQNGEVMGKWNTTIMVLSRDKEDYNSRCDRVKNVASILGCKIRVLSNLQREGYQQISPTYPQIKRIQETSSRYFPVSTFVGGFPFSSGGFNDGKGFYLGKNSSGGLILLDLWKRGSSRTNSNITIVGGSGSGKSTAIKHIIASEYARGTKIIVIDPESEYKDMCYNPLFEGNWIDVAGGKGGLINPLQIRPVPPDTDDENAEPQENDSIGDLAIHLKTLQTFFRLYIPSMDDRLRALLDQALVELYHKF